MLDKEEASEAEAAKAFKAIYLQKMESELS